MWDQKMKCCEDVQSWRTKTSVWKSTFPFWTSFSNKKIPEAPNLPVSHNQPTTLEAENQRRYRSTKNCRPSVCLRLAPRNCSIPINSHINMQNSTAEKSTFAASRASLPLPERVCGVGAFWNCCQIMQSKTHQSDCTPALFCNVIRRKP